MNTDEQTLIDGLFSRLQQAEKDAGPRDALAEQRIKDHVARQPSAAYYMAQAILVQEAALKKMDQQNKQLQQELEQARAQAQPPAQPQSSGGFLSSLFGGGSRDPAPAPQPSSTGGWRDSPRPPAFGGQPQQPQQPQQPYYPPQQQAPAGGGFMSGALKTAAGVAGGVMLAEGISSLFHHNAQPQEIVEIIKEEPSQMAGNNDNDWGNGGQQNVGNDSWGNQDPSGFSNTDYSNNDDGGGFFSDDDDYV